MPMSEASSGRCHGPWSRGVHTLAVEMGSKAFGHLVGRHLLLVGHAGRVPGAG